MHRPLLLKHLMYYQPHHNRKKEHKKQTCEFHKRVHSIMFPPMLVLLSIHDYKELKVLLTTHSTLS